MIFGPPKDDGKPGDYLCKDCGYVYSKMRTANSRKQHSTEMVSLSIKRVVSVFILRPNEGPPPVQQPQPQPRPRQRHGNDDYRVALFRRCATMPTFPGRWAGISGSIEDGDGNPLEAALRELREETNLSELFSIYNDSGGGGGTTAVGDAPCLLRDCIQQGLHVDVPSGRSDGAFGGRIIRVYPFALTLPSRRLSSVAGEDDGPADTSERTDGGSSATLWSNLEMKGTEHDVLKFLTIEDFLDMAEPCVPVLKLAFHHATHGSYLNVRDCASLLTLFVQHACCSNYSENLC